MGAVLRKKKNGVKFRPAAIFSFSFFFFFLGESSLSDKSELHQVGGANRLHDMARQSDIEED